MPPIEISLKEIQEKIRKVEVGESIKIFDHYATYWLTAEKMPSGRYVIVLYDAIDAGTAKYYLLNLGAFNDEELEKYYLHSQQEYYDEWEKIAGKINPLTEQELEWIKEQPQTIDGWLK